MNPCDICKGACCERIVINPQNDEWLKHHCQSKDGFYYLPVKCNMLDLGKCTIYKDRPETCKTYKVGSFACISAVKWKHNDRTQKRIFNLFPTSKD